MKYIFYTLSFIFCSLNIFSQQYEAPFERSAVSIVDDHIYLTGRPKKDKKSVEVLKLDMSLKVVTKTTIPYKKKGWPGMVKKVGHDQLALQNGYGSMFNPTMVCHLLNNDLTEVPEKEFSTREGGANFYYELQQRRGSEGVYLNYFSKKKGVELVGKSYGSGIEVKEIWKKTLLPESELSDTKIIYSDDFSSCILLAKENEKGKTNSIHVLKIEEATGNVLKKIKINMAGKLLLDFTVWKSGGEFIISGVYGAKNGALNLQVSEGFFIKSFDFANVENLKSSDTPITTLNDNLKTSGVGKGANGHIKVVELKKVGDVHKAVLFAGFWGTKKDPMNQSRMMKVFYTNYIQQVTIGADLKIEINHSRELSGEEARYFAHEYLVLLPVMTDDMSKGRIIMNDGYGTFNGGKIEVRIDGSEVTIGSVSSNIKSSVEDQRKSSFIPKDYKTLFYYDFSGKTTLLKVVQDKTFK